MYKNRTNSNKEIELFCKLIGNDCGLSFNPSNYLFVENRIESLRCRYGCFSLNDVIQKANSDLSIKYDLINLLTINETWFFRHQHHFEILKTKVFPEIIKRKLMNGDKNIKIWSAGCANGAEAFSILMTLLDYLGADNDFNIKIIGSDISVDSIKEAQNALYESRALKNVDCNNRVKYFIHEEYGKYRIKPHLLNYVTFEMLNIVKSWPPRDFDLIFCRNTMIYFSPEIKSQLIHKFANSLNKYGYLFTSANETINENNEALQRVYTNNEIIYQKKSSEMAKKLILFKDSNNMNRAINLMRNFGCHFDFLFNNPDVKRCNALKSLYVPENETEFVYKLLSESGIAYKPEEMFN
ncbi:MAG: protein-glutamate O-methyltransferase CheR [Candidatus Riflebacteria bacterium]